VAGPSTAGSVRTNQQERSKGCHICHDTTHALETCPFLNTNANNRRVGFSSEVVTKVRSNRGRYLTNGTLNIQAFKRDGGLVSNEATGPSSAKKK
jgi:hypothetical protein